MKSIVDCCHSAKLCAYAARDFRSHQYFTSKSRWERLRLKDVTKKFLFDAHVISSKRFKSKISMRFAFPTNPISRVWNRDSLKLQKFEASMCNVCLKIFLSSANLNFTRVEKLRLVRKYMFGKTQIYLVSFIYFLLVSCKLWCGIKTL